MTTTRADWSRLAASLRAQALQVSAVDLGLSPPPAVHGLVIDTAYSDRVFTLAALADGSVSWYVSNGKGCVGCGEHADVRRAAAELIGIAHRRISDATSTSDLAAAVPGLVRFFFLTASGVKMTETTLAEATRTESPWVSLYAAGQRVIQVAERVGAGQSLMRAIDQGLGGNLPACQSETETCLSVGNAVRRLRT